MATLVESHNMDAILKLIQHQKHKKTPDITL